ncbi:AMP-binding protein [Streptomyces sp. NPDC059894]|uniref:AMP-binding protein n=1 Tax=unclassified Streptomyces TaxID=2593676 RepID=UPI00365752EA
MLRGDLVVPLPELLRRQAERHPETVAFDDGHRAVTYRQLEARTRRLAGHLVELGLRQGDRAALLLDDRTELVESYLAVPRAGAIGVPVGPGASDDELTRLLSDSGARLVVTDAAHRERLSRLELGCPPRTVLVDGAGPHGYARLASAEPAVPAPDDLGLDEPAWLLYTAGTSGVPKGVLSTQRNCLWSVAACYVPVLGLGPGDRVLWPLPLYHSLAHIACVLAVTAAGASARIVGGHDPGEMLRIWDEYRPTVVAGVPATWHRLADEAAARGAPPPGPRVCLVGGAAATPALRRRIERTFGAPLADAYGSTETCGSIAISWPGSPVPGDASCGLPVLGLAVRLVDPRTGHDVPDGTEGEVWVRGPNVMAGYHNRPTATAEALADGWYHTGDLARRDRTGHLTITGRRTELIVRAGENIHPAEIEHVLYTVRGIADVAVAGRPHEVLGEVPVAYVRPAPGGFDPAEALAVCKARLAHGKVPENLYEVAWIPRTPAGKVDRRRLLTLPTRLRAVGEEYFPALYRLDWVPRPSVRRAGSARWALVGPHAERLARACPDAPVTLYRDVAALAAAVEEGLPPPPVALLGTAPHDTEPAGRRVRWLRPWLADPRLAGTCLAVTMCGAVTTGPGQPAASPGRAGLWARLGALQAEHPGRLALADIDDDTAVALLPAAVTAGEHRLAVRAGVVLAPRLERVATDHDRTPPLVFSAAGTTVLTGADTPCGAAVARHLVGAYGAAHLILLTAPGRAGHAAPVRAELTAAGAGVALRECDPADPGAVARAVRDVCAEPVTAVVHTGPPGARPAEDPSAVRHLYAATRGEALSAFVVLAPAAGLLGVRADGHDTAYAAMLDAVTGQLRDEGAPALCVGWGPWADDGTIGGLSERTALAMLDAALSVGQDRLLAWHLDTEPVLTGGTPSVLAGLMG